MRGDSKIVLCFLYAVRNLLYLYGINLFWKQQVLLHVWQIENACRDVWDSLIKGNNEDDGPRTNFLNVTGVILAEYIWNKRW